MLDIHDRVVFPNVAQIHRHIGLGADHHDGGVHLQVVNLLLCDDAAEHFELFVHLDDRVVEADSLLLIHKGPFFLLEVPVEISLALKRGDKNQAEKSDQNEVDGLAAAVQLHLHIFQQLEVVGCGIAAQDRFDGFLAVVAFGEADALAQIPGNDHSGNQRNEDAGDDKIRAHKTISFL